MSTLTLRRNSVLVKNDIKITTEQPTWTVANSLQSYAEKKPDQTLYIGIDINGKEAKRYTTSQFLARVEGVARGLLKHGVCIRFLYLSYLHLLGKS